MKPYFHHFHGSRAPTMVPELSGSTSDAAAVRGDVRNGRYWSMKAVRDSLIRDWSDMSLWIDFITASQRPASQAPMIATCISGALVTALLQLELDSILSREVRSLGQATRFFAFVSSLLLPAVW
ncbi:hypothetical protein F5X68DRAFT_218926 [Plectosphaerella plurivora]|uniref:Uncharacterized protein n=1 Tax=Plectosphaerella plurivora TaxID=936078 RepID=A0A9P9A4E4_9PEZI|nr:hypothetical protein F5X68DRAFT_218926 [Plectosphaerella plurivora]